MVWHALQSNGQNEADGIEQIEPHDSLNDPPEEGAGHPLWKEQPNVQEENG